MDHAVARNTLYLTVASIGQKALAFVYFIFIARVMQPEATGIYFIALSVTTIVSVLADFGITSVVIREVAKEPTSAGKWLRRVLPAKIALLLLAISAAHGSAFALGYGVEI